MISTPSARHSLWRTLAVIGTCIVGALCTGVYADDVLARFDDEPHAHAVFDRMVGAMQNAHSLSYECHHTWTIDGNVIGDYIYRTWLKKPNKFRVELETLSSGETTGVLVGDGKHAWTHWPQGRPQWELVPEDQESFRRTRLTSYRKAPTPPAKFSIGHALPYLSRAGLMSIINPSTFLGYTGSLIPHIDAIRSLGADEVNEEPCDKIEVSIMDGQRTWYFWLSQRDIMPRRQEQTVRVGEIHQMIEVWSNVKIDGAIPDGRFAWKPPDDWTEWNPPKPDDLLLKPGTQAPEFDLAAADGGRIKLADYRGQVVWLYFWRVGCPPCRTGMPVLQSLYDANQDRGLVALGYNYADEKGIALDFLQEIGATFPTVIDCSETAQELSWHAYRTTGVPVNYIIDRQGNVVDAWYGHNEGLEREMAALKRAGLELEQESP